MHFFIPPIRISAQSLAVFAVVIFLHVATCVSVAAATSRGWRATNFTLARETIVAMTKLQFKGSWNEVKGKLKQKYGQLTDNDLAFAEGKDDELLGRLQQNESFSNINALMIEKGLVKAGLNLQDVINEVKLAVEAPSAGPAPAPEKPVA